MLRSSAKHINALEMNKSQKREPQEFINGCELWLKKHEEQDKLGLKTPRLLRVGKSVMLEQPKLYLANIALARQSELTSHTNLNDIHVSKNSLIDEFYLETSIEKETVSSANADRDVERSVVVVGVTSSIAPRPISLGGIVTGSSSSDIISKSALHFLITLTLKKGFDSGYRLQDKPLEVPSGNLNSFLVVNWKAELLIKDSGGGRGGGGQAEEPFCPETSSPTSSFWSSRAMRCGFTSEECTAREQKRHETRVHIAGNIFGKTRDTSKYIAYWSLKQDNQALTMVDQIVPFNLQLVDFNK
uniref:Uncharacterized protein n=1 Tax=Solanum lycopersicum TaxID=4081 RepID=A0A3Q7ERZ0_SOLLC